MLCGEGRRESDAEPDLPTIAVVCLCFVMLTADWIYSGNVLYFMNVMSVLLLASLP